MIYVFDLDGTLSLVGDRAKELKKDPKDWDTFYDRCDEDEPNQAVLNLFRILDLDDHTMVVLTGRRESCRYKTLKWFEYHRVSVRTTHLIMRPDGNVDRDTKLKPRMLEDWLIVNLLEKKHKSEFLFFEDRNSMVNKWRELGYTCCQVAEGDF